MPGPPQRGWRSGRLRGIAARAAFPIALQRKPLQREARSRDPNPGRAHQSGAATPASRLRNGAILSFDTPSLRLSTNASRSRDSPCLRSPMSSHTEERRVGKEGVSTCRSRRLPSQKKKKSKEEERQQKT